MSSPVLGENVDGSLPRFRIAAATCRVDNIYIIFLVDHVSNRNARKIKKNRYDVTRDVTIYCCKQRVRSKI